MRVKETQDREICPSRDVLARQVGMVSRRCLVEWWVACKSGARYTGELCTKEELGRHVACVTRRYWVDTCPCLGSAGLADKYITCQVTTHGEKGCRYWNWSKNQTWESSPI